MNGIEKLIDHIMSESAAECEAVAAEAAAECGRIRERYAKAEQDEYWNIVNVGAKDAERRIERLLSLAALESKKQVLTTQQEMLTKAFELAAKKLLELPENEYTAFLSKLACGAAMTGDEQIILSAKDRKRIGAEVLKGANAALTAAGKQASLKLSEKTADIRGGLILSGGDIEVNCSIDSLVLQYKNELSPRVAAELFD